MTIDERFKALTMSLELLTRDVQDLKPWRSRMGRISAPWLALPRSTSVDRPASKIGSDPDSPRHTGELYYNQGSRLGNFCRRSKKFGHLSAASFKRSVAPVSAEEKDRLFENSLVSRVRLFTGVGPNWPCARRNGADGNAGFTR
jgi:hypothetical protein